jgi:hypothetical protein
MILTINVFQNVQTVSGAHMASYSIDTGVFPKGKEAMA